MSRLRGVVVGADQTQEWILPWWWERYRRKNSLPVAFVDLGLSFQMKDWCRERGALVSLRVADFAAEKEEMDPALVKRFEEDYGPFFWECRNGWFKKPHACLNSPFETSLWIDIDCDVRCNVEPLFEYKGVAMAKDQVSITGPYTVWSSGVMVFRRKEAMIKKWAKGSYQWNHLFRGDQELLSWMIAENGWKVTELPAVYNWSRSLGDNPDAFIYHWHGKNGKKVIAHEISQAKLNSSFPG